MLQQFTPLYEHQISNPQPVEAPKVTVKFPLLYRVTKDNRVHHIQGHAHPIPLDFMPDYVMQIISDSNCLLTESFYTLPLALQQALIRDISFYGDNLRFLTTGLGNSKDRFEKDVLETLALHTDLDCKTLQLENLGVTLLSTFFTMYIERRAIPEKLTIDEALIRHFKLQQKPIIELNEDTKHDYVDFCLKNETYLSTQLNNNYQEYLKGTAFLLSFGSAVKHHYQSQDVNKYMNNHKVKAFLETDVENIRLEPELITKETTAENQKWLTLFMREHLKGTNKMFLACGYAHLFLPEQGLLHLLQEQGFTIERVYETDLQKKHTNMRAVI